MRGRIQKKSRNRRLLSGQRMGDQVTRTDPYKLLTYSVFNQQERVVEYLIRICISPSHPHLQEFFFNGPCHSLKAFWWSASIGPTQLTWACASPHLDGRFTLTILHRI